MAKTELSASKTINMPEPGEDPNSSSNNGVDGNDSTNDNIIEKYCVCNGTDDGRRMILCENEQCSSLWSLTSF